MTSAGFPHSDIHGSSLASSSPWLFAGSRVLHRLLAPRHPPCALCSLTLTTAWLLPGDRLVPLSQFFGWVVEPEVSFVTSELAAFCALCSRSCPSRPDGRSEAASRPQNWFRFLLFDAIFRKAGTRPENWREAETTMMPAGLTYESQSSRLCRDS